MTTIPDENIRIIPEPEPELPEVPLSENTSITALNPDPDVEQLIAAIFAKYLERDLMERGYQEMGEELLEWSETTVQAQAETLPEE